MAGEADRAVIDLATVAFNVPWLIEEQIRLLSTHLADKHRLTVFDNSNDREAAREIERVCSGRVDYERLAVPSNYHHYALNVAGKRLVDRGEQHIGFLDHDVFPRRKTRLIPRIKPSGFYGVGQRHGPTDSLYLWPGFCFFSTEWLTAKQPRRLDFGGIRGADRKDDGDTGSMNAALFEDEDWSRMFTGEHGYAALREPDSVGLQSWGYEVLGGDWIHLSNGSGWMVIPRPDERERLCQELVASL